MTLYNVIPSYRFWYQLKTRMRLTNRLFNDMHFLLCIISKLLQIIGQISLSTGYVFNTFVRGKSLNSELEIWRQETRNIALSYV